MKTNRAFVTIWALVGGLLMPSGTTFAAQVCYSVRQAGDTAYQPEVCDGAQAGITGQSRAIENIKIRTLQPGAHVCYKVHVADYGWNSNSGTSLPVCNNQPAGIGGLRIEGIEILDDKLASNKSIYYRTHVQDLGWMPTVWDGALGGTTGQWRRLESIQISIGARPLCPPNWQNYGFATTDYVVTNSVPFNPPTLPTTQTPTCAVPIGMQIGQTVIFFTSVWPPAWPYPQYIRYVVDSVGMTLYLRRDRYENLADAFFQPVGGPLMQEGRADRNWTSSPNGTGITMMDMVGR